MICCSHTVIIHEFGHDISFNAEFIAKPVIIHFMIALNHALTGEAIALTVRRPMLAVLLAFLSHFIVDAIPHLGNVAFYTVGSPIFPYILALDGLLTVASVIIVCYRAKDKARLILACAFAAILPDILWLWYYAAGRPDFWFFNFHKAVQWYEQPVGGIVEVCYAIGASLLIAYIISKRRTKKALPKK